MCGLGLSVLIEIHPMDEGALEFRVHVNCSLKSTYRFLSSGLGLRAVDLSTHRKIFATRQGFLMALIDTNIKRLHSTYEYGIGYLKRTSERHW